MIKETLISVFLAIFLDIGITSLFKINTFTNQEKLSNTIFTLGIYIVISLIVKIVYNLDEIKNKLDKEKIWP